MPAAVRNIVLEAGATFQWDLTVTDATTGAALNLTGCTGAMEIRSRPAGDLIATPTVTIDDPTNGGVLVELAHAAVTALSFTDAQYDLFITFSGGVKRKVAKGSVTFEKRITTS